MVPSNPIASVRDPADCSNLSCAVLGRPNGANIPAARAPSGVYAVLLVAAAALVLVAAVVDFDLVLNNNNPLRELADPLNDVVPLIELGTGTGGADNFWDVNLLRFLPNFFVGDLRLVVLPLPPRGAPPLGLPLLRVLLFIHCFYALLGW